MRVGLVHTRQRSIRLEPTDDERLQKRAQKLDTQPAILARRLVVKGLDELDAKHPLDSQ
jgi:hypothetical protein